MYALTIKQTKIHYAIIHITKQITFFTYSHIYTHAYIGEYTCTHMKNFYIA